MPAITLSPTSGKPGITVTVKGTGFGKRQKVKLHIDPPNGAVKSYTCTTTGTFTGTVVTGSASSIGVHTVTVTSATSTTVLASGTFTLVSPAPVGPQVTAGPTVSNITKTSISVTWTLSEKCTGQIQYGQSTSYGQLSMLESSFDYSTHIQALSGLIADTTYHLRVIGKNAAGLSYTSADVSFKTAAEPVQQPTPPSNLRATAGIHLVTLSWELGMGSTSFNIYRDGVKIASSVTSPYTDTSVTNGVTYSYEITGLSSGGEGPKIGPVTATPVAAPPPGSYPPNRSGIQTVAVNGDARPGYLSTITDSTWGTHVIRISNVNDRKNQYAKHQEWSKDGNYIYLQFGWMVDAHTYANLGQIGSGTDYPLWSNVEPHAMWGARYNQAPILYHLTMGGSWTAVRDFTAQGYTEIAIGDYEGTISDDDHLINFIGRKGSQTWLLNYDPVSDVIRGQRQVPVRPNGTSVSRSGDYTVVNNDGHGLGEGLGSWLYARDMSPIRQLNSTAYSPTDHLGSPWGHQDNGWDSNGNEVLVFVEPGGGSTDMQRFDNAQETIIAGGIFGVGHVSCTNYDRPGWAYLSSNSYYPGAAGCNQAVAVKLDGSGICEVFACLHSANPATSQDYESSPHVSANRDGTKVIWGSVWNAQYDDNMYAFVAGVSV